MWNFWTKKTENFGSQIFNIFFETKSLILRLFWMPNIKNPKMKPKMKSSPDSFWVVLSDDPCFQIFWDSKSKNLENDKFIFKVLLYWRKFIRQPFFKFLWIWAKNFYNSEKLSVRGLIFRIRRASGAIGGNGCHYNHGHILSTWKSKVFFKKNTVNKTSGVNLTI